MSYKIIGKYIKDLNFKIPNPKVFSLLSKDISNYKINIDIKSDQLKDRIIEVQTTLNLTPIKDDLEKISTKIIYSTIIELEDGIKDKKDKDDKIIEGNPDKIKQVTDHWKFTKNILKKGPNWHLSEIVSK